MTTAVFFHTACFPMLYSVALSPAKRMHTPAPGSGSSSGSGPAQPLLSSAKPSTSFLMSAQARPSPAQSGC